MSTLDAYNASLAKVTQTLDDWQAAKAARDEVLARHAAELAVADKAVTDAWTAFSDAVDVSTPLGLAVV